MPKASRKPPRNIFDASQFSRERAMKIAQARWLSVSELERILDSSNPLLPITNHPPKQPPGSGSLFLYDRSATRNYKDDGHVWIKKRNSPKVREDHVKLRVDGKYRVAGCYVHSATIGSMHRRAYHLLDPNAEHAPGEDNHSTSPNPTVSHPDGMNRTATTAPKALLATTSKAISSLVLVHYLDTQVASEVLRRMEATGEILDSIGFSAKSLKSGSRTAKLATRESESFDSSYDANADYTNVVVNGASAPITFVTESYGQYSMDPYNQVQVHQPMDVNHQGYADHSNGIVIEDITMMDNFLFSWNQNSESSFNDHHSGSQQRQHFSNPSETSFYDFIHNTFDPYVTNGIIENGHISHNQTPEPTNSPVHRYSMSETSASSRPGFTRQPSWMTESIPDVSHDHRNEMAAVKDQNDHKHLPQPAFDNRKNVPDQATKTASNDEMPPPDIMLPKVVDITPDQVIYRSDSKKSAKIVVSLSAPIMSHCSDYHCFIAFCNITNQHLNVDDMYLSSATEMNPYTFKCEAPNVPIVGMRSLFIVGVSKKLEVGDDIASISHNLRQEWEYVVNNMSRQSTQIVPVFFAWRKATDVCFLSQISDENVEFSVSSVPSGYKQQTSVSMANAPSSESFSIPSDVSQKSDDHTDLPAPPAAMASIAGALSDFPNNTLYAGMDAEYTSDVSYHGQITKKRNATVAGTEAADTSVSWNQAAAVGADVDRHCKIRFVEKLTTVIAGAEEGESSAMDSDWEIPSGDQSNVAENTSATISSSHHHRRASSGVHQNVEAFLDDGQLNDIDDDQLDSLLDSLLIRIVEMLVEMSSNDVELQEELNSPDKSGFTLLHYASLYNLQSLLPVLISRGANVDTLSARGKLTPLHLACGAGNFAVVELLTRNGCAIEVFDSAKLTPSDHAIRNGFPEIAKWLAEKVGKVVSRDNSQTNFHPSSSKGIGLDPESKFLLQSAFSNLSLKDKLAFNLMVKKGSFANTVTTKKRGKSNPVGKNNIQKLSIPEGPSDDESQEETASVNNNDEQSFIRSKNEVSMENVLRKLDDEVNDVCGDSDNDDERSLVSSCISETDRESLDVAMSLMNEEELDEIENSSNAMRDDVRKWMLRHNYKSLKEATLYLQSSMKAKSADNRNKNTEDQEEVRNDEDVSKNMTYEDGSNSPETRKKSNMATKKSIKNFKNQTLATLVIRKNIFNGGRQSIATTNTSPPPAPSAENLNE